MNGLRFLGLGRASLVAAALVFGACDDGDDGDTGTAGDVTFADVEPIFQTNCVEGCHEPGGLWPTFDMSGDTHAAIVEVTGPTQGTQCNLVEPGAPEDSYLWHKIAGTHAMSCGGSGLQMPATDDLMGSDPLSQADMDLVEDWILAGAPM